MIPMHRVAATTIIEIKDIRGQPHDFSIRLAAHELSGGTVMVTDYQGAYTVRVAEAERCLMLEPHDFNPPSTYRGVIPGRTAYRSVDNARRNGPRQEPDDDDPWAAGRMDWPSPWD